MKSDSQGFYLGDQLQYLVLVVVQALKLPKQVPWLA